MQDKLFGKIVIKIIITLVLTVLGGWVFYFNWLQRPIHYRNYTFSIEESQRLRPFARAQYAYGLHAWFQNNPETAVRYFRQAVSQDIFFLDAWHRLAEAEAAMGQRQKSTAILMFSADLTENIFRWKWPQILLARDLGMNDILYRNTNFLLSHRVMAQNALQLLHLHIGGDVTAAMSAIESDNLVQYLTWLMRWGMTADTLTVWQKIRESGKPDAETGLQYSHFLLGQKRIAESVLVWQDYFTLDGITNGGFEKEITRRGFDWRHWRDEEGAWNIERITKDAYEGKYALKVSFMGRKNISFQNFFQIVPVSPLQRFRLSYAWKSNGITTDQGPFIEITGYDKKGLFQSGPMITGTHKWSESSIEFRPPVGCRAAMVRVRRRPSHRFDSKIKGSLWLDDFRLELLDSEEKQTLSDKFL